MGQYLRRCARPIQRSHHDPTRSSNALLPHVSKSRRAEHNQNELFVRLDNIFVPPVNARGKISSHRRKGLLRQTSIRVDRLVEARHLGLELSACEVRKLQSGVEFNISNCSFNKIGVKKRCRPHSTPFSSILKHLSKK